METHVENGPRRIRFVYVEPFYPYAFLKEGETTGIGPELLHLALVPLGFEVEWTGMNLEEVQTAVQAGRADAIGVFARIPERTSSFDFSDPLCTTEAGLFCRKAATPRFQLEDHAGRTVCTPALGPLASLIQSRYPDVRVKTVADYAAALEAVLSGEASAAALNLLVGEALVQERFPGSFHLPDRTVFKVDLCVAVCQGKQPEVIAVVNEGLRRMQKEGTREAVIKRWQGQ
jgi:polar amino acid transport system substrate-binding protein